MSKINKITEADRTMVNRAARAVKIILGDQLDFVLISGRKGARGTHMVSSIADAKEVNHVLAMSIGVTHVTKKI